MGNGECMRCQHRFDGTIITEAEGQEGTETTNEMNDTQQENESTIFGHWNICWKGPLEYLCPLFQCEIQLCAFVI